MKKMLVIFFSFFIIFNLKSQEKEILLNIKYDMSIKETTKIIKSLEEPFYTELGGFKLKLTSGLARKKLTKGIVFHSDVSVKERIIDNALLNKRMGANEITQIFDLMKNDLIEKGYKIIYTSPVTGLFGSYIVAQKDDKIVGLIYSYTSNSNTYRTYYDYSVYFSSSEILKSDKDFFKFFRVKNIENDNVENDVF